MRNAALGGWHVLWVIANSPEAEIAGSPETYADRIIEPALHERARSLWLAHLEASGSNPKIVANAARFFILSEPERARQLLERGRELEPLDPQWSERLAQLDMLATRRPGAGAADSARRALEAGKTPGSPSLDAFGPDLSLGSELLANGERSAVIEYLRRISRFWKGREDALEEWIILIQAGKTPELNRFRARRAPRCDPVQQALAATSATRKRVTA